MWLRGCCIDDAGTLKVDLLHHRGDEKEGPANGSGPGRPRSKMEMIIEQERAAAAAKASKAAANAAAAAAASKAASVGSTKRIPWLLPGLVVKVWLPAFLHPAAESHPLFAVHGPFAAESALGTGL